MIGAFETERLPAEPLDRSHLGPLAALHRDERDDGDAGETRMLDRRRAAA